jgi:hypothetical protein
MKFFFSMALLFFVMAVKAQNPCDFSTNVKDSLGDYRATKSYLIYERNFAGTQSYLYFTLALTDGLPTLNVQSLQKSKDFIKANCLDKNSRIYLQLNNGKIISLLHIDSQECGTGVRNEEVNNRILLGYFLFTKDTFDELKASPVSMMRIKYTTETVDYIFKEELKSELDGQTYRPGDYFINTLHCLDN